MRDYHRKGGLERIQRGCSYLFSGTLVCGVCGGSMVICAGGGKRGYTKYRCHAHKHTGVCDNKLMIRQDRLEEQMLDAIGQRLPAPGTLDSVIERCEQELKRRRAEMKTENATVTLDSLKKDLEERKRRQAKLIEAIETAGDIAVLTERLRGLEREVKHIEEAIARYRPIKLDDTVTDIREHVTKALFQLRNLLADAGEKNVALAKAALAKHVGKLVLTPGTRNGRPVYKVAGAVTVDGGVEKCRMPVVARDGIGTPTAVDGS